MEDEKTKSHHPDFSPSVGNEGGTPAYAAETNQPAGIVYVQAPREPETGPPAKDYFGLSLFTLLCCFWPLGLVALIKSVEVRRHNGDGNFADARKASKDAHLFNKLGIIIGSISLAISLIVLFVVILFQGIFHAVFWSSRA